MLKINKKFLKQKVRIIFLKISSKIIQFRKINTKSILIIGLGFFVLIWWVGSRWVAPKYQQYKLRTHFYDIEEGLNTVSEEKVKTDIDGQCEQIRKSADRLFSVSEIKNEIEKSVIDGKLKLVGKNETNPEQQKLIIDIKGKEIELLCFDFSSRLVVEGEGKLEIGFSNFENVEGNAINLKNGEGKIHHNLILNSSKSGIFVDNGKWEIYDNIIKDNLSYGVYGGYGAELNLHENAIKNNGGYEVRILEERKVFD